jgi:hypothetical protein
VLERIEVLVTNYENRTSLATTAILVCSIEFLVTVFL